MLHLFWDSFTHPSPFLDRNFPLLAMPVWVGGEQTPLSYLVGLASSVLGGALIIWAVWRMPVRQVRIVPAAGAVRRYWGIVLLVTIALIVQWTLVAKPELLDGGIAAISYSLVGLVVASVYTTYTNRKLVHERL